MVEEGEKYIDIRAYERVFSEIFENYFWFLGFESLSGTKKRPWGYFLRKNKKKG